MSDTAGLNLKMCGAVAVWLPLFDSKPGVQPFSRCDSDDQLGKRGGIEGSFDWIVAITSRQ